MRSVRVERRLDCGSSPHALWCIITDTERLNRAIGLHKIELSPLDDESAARYLVRTVSGGFPLEYEERPYEWVENERFTIRRPVRKGAVHYMENSFVLKPAGAGTQLLIRLEVGLRFALLAPIVKSQLRRFGERLAREIEAIDADLTSGRGAEFSMAGARIHEAAFERARAALMDRVAAEQRPAAERIGDWVASAPDPAIDRMRPFELADAWEIDRRVVLATMLHAVIAGLVELRWDIVCPSCRTASDRVEGLIDIGADGHCQLCDISFAVELDRAVEATFRPAPAVRTLDSGPYCIGGPARTPHVLVQVILPADGEAVLQAPATAGSYRLFVRGGARVRIDVREGGAGEARIEVGDEESALAPLVLVPSARITVVQRGGSERHVKLERRQWPARAATAAVVSTLPEFRRLFGSDVLRQGVSLRTGRVALLFTDLTQSTALYRSMGDAKAFQLVHDHFDLVQKIVAEHHGTVVKTMGDAVMAAFVDDTDAVRAALGLHASLRAFRGDHPGFEQGYFKIGIYAGPCYCVTANGILDYFGQTVNIAARLQAQAGAGELVLAEEACEAMTRAGIIDDERLVRFAADLKGVGRLKVARLPVDSEVHSEGADAGSRSRQTGADVTEAPLDS